MAAKRKPADQVNKDNVLESNCDVHSSEDENISPQNDHETNSDTDDRVNRRFKVNSLFINVEKTHYIQFKTKNKPTFDISIICDNNLITPVPSIKFLGIYLQDSINWSCHIEYTGWGIKISQILKRHKK
jgi:hypothetical protein